MPAPERRTNKLHHRHGAIPAAQYIDRCVDEDEAPLELSFREMLANDWEVVGQFMHDRTAPGQPATLAAEGLLDLRKINGAAFKLADFRRAVDAAAMMQSLGLTAVVP